MGSHLPNQFWYRVSDVKIMFFKWLLFYILQWFSSCFTALKNYYSEMDIWFKMFDSGNNFSSTSVLASQKVKFLRFSVNHLCKVQIFWEGQKHLKKYPICFLTFNQWGQNKWEIFSNVCGLLRISELERSSLVFLAQFWCVCLNDSFYSLALHVWMSEWLFLFTYFTGVIYGQSETPLIMDVTEGEDVLLKCRFQPELSQRASQLFWIRTNREGHDNVAIGETPYQTNYM